MQVATSHTNHMASGLPSPTLTNPDLILPYDSPAASTPRRAQRIPSPPLLQKADSSQSAGEDGPSQWKSVGRNLRRNGEGPKLRKVKTSNELLEKENRAGNTHSSSEPGAKRFGGLAPSTLKVDHDSPTASTATFKDDDRSQWHNSVVVEDQDATSPVADGSHDRVMNLGRPTYGFPPLDNEKDGFSAPPELEDGDPYSHAAMSIRAEQILANAKKRLTVSSKRQLFIH